MKYDYWEASKIAQAHAAGQRFTVSFKKGKIYVKVGKAQRATCLGDIPELSR